MMRKVFGRTFLGGVALVVIVLVSRAVWSSYLAKRNLDLPTFYTLPEFSLIDQAGKRVNRRSLLEKVWVADFFYTRCEDTCPLQTAEMARLQKEFAGATDFRLVSFTIDPQQDPPEVIAEYANRFAADAKRWLFLTGQKEDMHRLIRNGFRLNVAIREASHGPASHRKRGPGIRVAESVGDRPYASRYNPHGSHNLIGAILGWVVPSRAWGHHPNKVAPRHTHSPRFVLVDRKARIRGYYHSHDKESLRVLRHDLNMLLAR
jgi:cytochrome oxidase Cu insertion factor (SCO1/SenC/PrrC family)